MQLERLLEIESSEQEKMANFELHIWCYTSFCLC